MTISEVTSEYVADFLRLDSPTKVELAEIGQMLESATEYIKSYTGLDADDIDEYADLTQALLVLIADMFDNRNMQIEKPLYNNRTVTSILNMHQAHLL